VSSWDLLRGLPVEIETVESETLTRQTPRFVRKTTVLHLGGRGEEGLGEDVTYDSAEHDRFPRLALEGSWTLESFSGHVGGLALFATPPEQHAALDYRRWAVESAALDVALRQAGTTLAAALEREARPLAFVSSNRDWRGWRALYPQLRYKLDPTADWTSEDFAELAATDAVEVADLKGAYHGTVVDNPADPELYSRVIEAFPRSWIEDPDLTPETDALLEPHRDRVTWDAPIHSWADVEALPFAPRCLNCKPSRFGALWRLFEFYDRCAEQGIALYGGGQFELGVGRRQIQLLAALFHPDGWNDVAPAEFNDPEPAPGLPESPLSLVLEPGFRAHVNA
jgi:hypothetical protein